MLKKIREFFRSPAGKMFVVWVTPIIIAFVQRKLTGEKDDKKSNKGKRS